MMGGKGGLSDAGTEAGAPVGFQGLHSHCGDHAAKPLPRARNLAYPEAPQPLGPPQMNDEPSPSPAPAQPAPAGARKSDPKAGERLAAALRENLRRRKQQARARRSDADPVGGEGRD